MRQSDDLDQLFTALSAAQGEIENAAKDSENPGFKRGNSASKYADLASVRDAIREPFAKHGLAYIQFPRTSGAKVSVETILSHKSGQFIADTLEMTATQNTPQGIGSTITYARRYALMSISGIAPEDDDGNAASARDAAPRQQQAEDDGFSASTARYVKNAKIRIGEFKTLADLKAWWAGEAKTMDDFFDSENDPQFKALKAAYVERGTKLQSAEMALNGVSSGPAATNGERLTDDHIPY